MGARIPLECRRFSPESFSMPSQGRGIALLLLTVSLVFALSGCDKLQPIFSKRPSEKMPAFHPVTEMHYADQNWSAYQREWFYHTAQGTELMPFPWFIGAGAAESLKAFGTVPKFPTRAPIWRVSDSFPTEPASTKSRRIAGRVLLKTRWWIPKAARPWTCWAFPAQPATPDNSNTGERNSYRRRFGTDRPGVIPNRARICNGIHREGAVPWRFERFAEEVLGENTPAKPKANCIDDSKRS